MAAIPVLVLLLWTAGAGAARARHKAPAKCLPGHSQQIVVTAQAQLYVALDSYELPGIYGCVYEHRPVLLGPLPSFSAQGGEGITHEKLAGVMVAYEKVFIGGYESGRAERRVIVRDLRSGRVLHRVPDGTEPTPHPGGVGIGNVVSLVLKTDGAVAWTAEDGNIPSPSNPSVKESAFQVEAVDASGMRLLASGGEIDPHSLRLVGSTLYWTQEGKTMSATLN